MSRNDIESPAGARQSATVRPGRRRRSGLFRSVLVVSIAASTIVGVLVAPGPSVAAGEPDTKVGEKTDDPQASDKTMSKEGLDIMMHQAKFQDAIILLYKEHERNPQDGFAGVAFEGDGLTLYYKGELSKGMSAAVDSARKVGQVVVKPAAHSLAELLDAGKRIRDAEKVLGNSDIQEIGYLPDGSGITVEKMPLAAAQSLRQHLQADGKAFTNAEAVLDAAAVDVPVKVRTANKTIRTMADLCDPGASVCRNNDSPAWNGGGRFESWRPYHSDDGSTDRRAVCTTGFGVWANGYYRVLTAAHCGTPPDLAYQGNSDYAFPDTAELMGPVSDDAWAYDVMLINGPGSLLIFDGGPNTSNTKTVVSYGYWSQNELVCQSGISSGVVCDLKQTSSVDIKVACFDENGNPAGDSDGDCGYWMYGMIRTEQQSGLQASRPGDSGGPVFTLMPNISQVRAKGILSAGDHNHVMYFQDWDTIDSLFNIYPKYCYDYGCL